MPVRVYKFPLSTTCLGDGVFKAEVSMPEDSRVLTVEMQHTQICLWALVDIELTHTVTRQFEVYGTGRDIKYKPENLEYVGTVHPEPFVWHVFERVRA